MRSSDYKAAKRDAQRALQLSSNDEERGQACNLTGSVLFREYLDVAKKEEELCAAKAEFRQAVELDPKFDAA
jgi:hypothetical protein